MHHRPSDFIHFTCTHDSLSLTRAACGERRSPAPSIYGRRGSVRQLACTEQLLPQYNFYHTPFASLSYTSQSIFELVLPNLSGTGDKPQLRVEGETLRTIVLVGRTVSGAGWRWGLDEHEVLLIAFMVEGFHLQSSMRVKNGTPIPSPSAIKHALLLRQPRFEPT